MKDKLKSFFTEHWTYMAVNAACKLHLFDHLIEPNTVSSLARKLSLNEEKLLLLLSALHQANFLEKTGDHYSLNALSEFLTENNPESLKYACLNWGAEHLNAWQHLDFSIKTGKSSFEKIYGKPFFDYLSDHPEKLDEYHKAMYQYAKDDYNKLPEIIDFSQFNSVMDVGGGYGAAIEAIRAKNPQLECVLFDLPEVLDKVSIPNVKKVSGSFFDKIPVQSEAIILSRILHDWNNERANIIFNNCFQALTEGGTLYVIENCADNNQVDLSLLSLNMTVMCESHERTASGYISLCEKTGFYFEDKKQLNDLQTILIFKV